MSWFTVRDGLQKVSAGALALSWPAVSADCDAALADVQPLVPQVAPLIASFPLNGPRALIAMQVGGTAALQYDRFLLPAVFTTPTLNTFFFAAVVPQVVRLAPLHLGATYTLVVKAWDDAAAASGDWSGVPEVARIPYTTSADGKREASAGFQITVGLPVRDPTGKITGYADFPTADYVGFWDYDDEHPVPFAFHYNAGAREKAKQTHALGYDNDFDWQRGTAGTCHVVRVPLALNAPRVRPRATRQSQAFPYAPQPKQLHLHYCTRPRPDMYYEIAWMANGLATMATRNLYYEQDLHTVQFRGAIIDGPPGIARQGMSTWLWVGHNTGKYLWDAKGSSFRHVLPDDSIITLAGWRDEYISYYGDAAISKGRVFVGNWDASIVPIDVRTGKPATSTGPAFFLDVWASAPDPRTTPQGKPTNPVIAGQVTHDGDVYWYWYDSGDDASGGRLGVMIFRGNDDKRGTMEQYGSTLPNGAPSSPWRTAADPPRIGVLLTGLSRDIVADMDFDTKRMLIGLTQRKLDKVILVKPPSVAPRGQPFVNDCAVVGTLVQSSKPARTYGSFKDDGQPWDQPSLIEWMASQAYTLAQRQAEPCVAPEGLRYWPWADRWSLSSRAQSGIKFVDGETHVADPGMAYAYVSGAPLKFFMLTHDVSDGGAYQQGTMGICAFDGGSPHFAMPQIIVPRLDGSYGAPQSNIQRATLNGDPVVTGTQSYVGTLFPPGTQKAGQPDTTRLFTVVTAGTLAATTPAAYDTAKVGDLIVDGTASVRCVAYIAAFSPLGGYSDSVVAGNMAIGVTGMTYPLRAKFGPAKFGIGMLIFSDVQEGLGEITLAAAGESVMTATVAARLKTGLQKLMQQGLRITIGFGGATYLDVDDPTDPDILAHIVNARDS